MNEYRSEAASISGLVAQLVRYVSSGHLFYVQVRIPDKKDPKKVDRKLIARYGADKSRWQRKRRELKDQAGMHYIRYQNRAVLMATKGKHKTFYEDHGLTEAKKKNGEKSNIRDIRRESLIFEQYAIRYAFSDAEKRWKVSVRLSPETYRQLKAHMLTISVWDSYRDKKRLQREFSRLPYQVYEPVYKQLLAILRACNRARRRRGFDKICPTCLRQYRRLVKVFVEDDSEQDIAA